MCFSLITASLDLSLIFLQLTFEQRLTESRSNGGSGRQLNVPWFALNPQSYPIMQCVDTSLATLVNRVGTWEELFWSHLLEHFWLNHQYISA